MTLAVKFAFFGVVFTYALALPCFFFDLEFFEVSIICRFSLKRNFFSFVLVGHRSIRLWMFRAVFCFICGCSFKFCFPWHISMLAIGWLVTWDLFVFVVFLIFCFTIKLSWTWLVFVFLHWIPLLNSMRLIKLIVTCLKGFGVVVPFLVLMSAGIQVRWFYSIGFVIMMIGCFTLKPSSHGFWAMMFATGADLADTSSIILPRLGHPLVSWWSKHK